MRRLAQTLVVLAAFAAGLAKTNEAPNIVFILIDDMGWKDLGCTGRTTTEEPPAFAGVSIERAPRGGGENCHNGLDKGH